MIGCTVRSNRRSSRLLNGLLTFVLLSAALVPSYAGNKPKEAFVPGLALAPEVLQADGVTPRTYNTPKGLSYWTNDLPILQGDKVKLNVFAATGGAELKEVKVRLDNTKIADLTATPWNTVIDTAKLPAGYHMVEVWAQGTGDRPQSSTKTLSFYVAKEMPAQYAVKGSQQILQGGSVTSVPLESVPSTAEADVVPDPPAFLKAQTADDGARVVLSAKPAAAASSQLGTPVGDSALTITEPTVFSVESAPGSTATQYAYVLARGGRTISAAPRLLNLNYARVKIQKRTDTTPGLRSGPVTLWVWGVDKEGHPSAPVKTQLIVP